MPNKQQPNFMASPQAAKLLKDKAAVEQIVKSPDTKALMQMLNQTAGGGLQAAAEAAMKGDASQLQGLLDRLMKDPSGAQVVNRINQSVKGK